MHQLRQNILNIFGEKGEEWISKLPTIIAELQNYWELQFIEPVQNMTFNYVAKAVRRCNEAVVLKISCDGESIGFENEALRYFEGNGAITLISQHNDYHALLLQQARPGTTLKSLYPENIEYVMDCYIETMSKLHNKRLINANHHRHIKNWLSAIDRLTEHDCPQPLIKQAITLKNQLLSTCNNEIFLHGDLHHDNILKHEDSWLAIDPKGVIGEPEFEIAAFDFMYINELADNKDVKSIFDMRVERLAEKAKLDSQRIKDWVFVRLLLMIAWYVEDNGDPSWAVKLAQRIL